MSRKSFNLTTYIGMCMCLVLLTEGSVSKDVEKIESQRLSYYHLSLALFRGVPGFQANYHLYFSLKIDDSALGLLVSIL